MIFKFLNKKKQLNLPDYLVRYNTLNELVFNSDILISDTKFVVFDLETTGFNLKTDKILSIGAVLLLNNQINVNESLELFVKQKKQESSAVSIHGIVSERPDMIDESSALEIFINYIGNNVLVGHNIFFDISFINKLLNEKFGIILKNKVLDTIDLYKRQAQSDKYSDDGISLDKLCDEFDIRKSDRHTALGDSYLTSLVFMKLLNRLEKRGVGKLKDLVKRKFSVLT